MNASQQQSEKFLIICSKSVAVIADCDDNGKTMTKAKASTTMHTMVVSAAAVVTFISTALCYSLDHIDMRISLFIHSTIQNGQGYTLEPLPHSYMCVVL